MDALVDIMSIIGTLGVAAMKHAELAGTDYLRFAGGRALASIADEGAQ
jgi:hypothetical protein